MTVNKIDTDKVSLFLDKSMDCICDKVSCYDCPAFSFKDDYCSLQKIKEEMIKKWKA